MREGEICPTCGRGGEQWDQRTFEGGKQDWHADGEKAEDTDHAYRRWHRKLASSLYCMNIDQLEYRFFEEQPVPVAVLELTRIVGAPNPPASYFASILKRGVVRDGQVRTLMAIADRLRVCAYYVAYMKDLSAFHVCDLDSGEWTPYSRAEYINFLALLSPKGPPF